MPKTANSDKITAVKQMGNEMKKEKMKSLQALRAFAFLGIFVFHAGFIDLGAWGVSVFFVLSGFLMMYSYYDRPTQESISLKSSIGFSSKKIKKLYPLHLVTMVIAISYMVFDKILNNALEYSYLLHIAKTAALSIPLLQTWVPKMYVAFALNGPSWYLSVSLFLYACFPYLLRFFREHISMKNASVYLAGIYIVQTILAVTLGRLNMPEAYTNEWSKWFTYIFPAFRLGDFSAGCVLGYMFMNRNKDNCGKGLSASIFEIITIILVVLSVYIYKKLAGGSHEWLRYTTIFLPSSLALVWIFAINKGIITQILTNPITVYVGNISPYAFLIHQVVICWGNYLLRTAFGANISLWILATINLFVTVALSQIVSSIKDRRKRC